MEETDGADAIESDANASGDKVPGTDAPIAPEIGGSTTVDARMDFEITALAFESMIAIGHEIADRSKTAVTLGGADLVVVGGADILGQIASGLDLLEQLGLFEEALEGAIKEHGTGLKTEAAHEEGVVETIGAASLAAGSLSTLLNHFRTETTYVSRDVAVPTDALLSIVTGRLAANGIPVALPDFLQIAPLANEHSPRFLTRLARIRRLATTLEDQGEISSAEAVDQRVGSQALHEFVDSLAKHPMSDLVRDTELVRAIDGARRAYLLVPTLLKTGGSLRIRKNIFTMLLNNDGASLSAGATAEFVLWDLKTAKVMLADVIYHTSGSRRLGAATQISRLSNVGNGELPTAASSSLAPEHELRRTPNEADDSDAAMVLNGVAEESASGKESAAPREWRVAESLKTMLAQVNRMAPRRLKASDGTIGDADHATRKSDHNPWVIDGGKGVVTAMDITHDPRHGCSAAAIAESLTASRDHRIKYVIWNRRIAYFQAINGAAAWEWRRYTGENPHDKHVHVSVRPDKILYDSTERWAL